MVSNLCFSNLEGKCAETEFALVMLAETDVTFQVTVRFLMFVDAAILFVLKEG